MGDLILVTLDVNIPNERETYLAIDDALPAIFEAVNPDFKTSETQRVNAQRQTRSLYATHSEIRKDRVLFFADYVFGEGTTACSISPVSSLPAKSPPRPRRSRRCTSRSASVSVARDGSPRHRVRSTRARSPRSSPVVWKGNR